MRFAASTIVALAAILSTTQARPHNRQGASGLVADSGSTNPLMDWLSSLLGALPTGGAGSGSGLPGFGGSLPTGGAGDGGFGSFPTATLEFPSGIFPTDPATVPTGGSGGPSFELPGFSDAPTPTFELPGFSDVPTPSSVAGVFPSNSAVPTGGVTAPATTAPATLPTPGEDPLSTVSFVFASSSADNGFGGFPGFPGFGKKA
ncbi:hypothetical protein DPSP01_009764 [Paraphaeosphaeria sporulosa]|uniref:Uncharacterized protein n=1 Tax=Paraphaeosphaeria sporulosa TaxID=1460663 RepID=A0A177C5Z3_9PLEO|nr:uncharacterized protein CC84DRAFT_1166811 [Paraphaeosphaeria sporulosa]OAG03043.1 hypothetical protein CC84DRAFT_1166811 [Paraphaeosphaeria sporulosa]